jgi:hypothetical protein
MRNAHRALTMTCALATAGVGMSAATAVAQEATQTELPEVVVQASQPQKKKPAKQATSTRLTDVDEPAAGAAS